MTRDWAQTTLDSVATIIGRGITPKYDNNGDCIVINQKCVRDGRVSLEQARRHDSSTNVIRADKVLCLNDILVNSTGVGTVGRTAPVRSLPEKLTVDSHLTIIRPMPSVDPRWLAYAVSFAEPEIVAMAEGSTGQTELSRDRLALLEVLLPPPSVQHTIAATLGALDDKIESNREAIEKVLALARALYERALIRGIREVKLGSVAQFHNRRRIPLSSQEREARPGNIPYYGATGIFGYVDEFLFDEVLVLVGEDGSVVRDDGGPVIQYIWGKAWINNHAHALTGQGISNELLFLALDRSDIRPLVTGAVQPKVSMGNLRSLELRLPPESAQASLESCLALLFGVWRGRAEEIRHLERLRDSLLPALLSGRLYVLEAEQAIEDAIA